MASPKKVMVTVPGQVDVAVTEAVLATGTRLAQATVMLATQVMVGGGSCVFVQAVGSCTWLALVEIAPEVESPRPIRVAPLPRLIAPFTRTVPWKNVLLPTLKAPFIWKYTLHRLAPLISTMLENGLVDKAPSIWKINRALGLPCPFRTKAPFSTAAVPMQ